MKKVFKTIGLFFLYCLASILGGIMGILVGVAYIVGCPGIAINYLRHPERIAKAMKK